MLNLQLAISHQLLAIYPELACCELVESVEGQLSIKGKRLKEIGKWLGKWK